MSDDAPANHLTEEAELREHYRDPSELVRSKIVDRLDEPSRGFIAASPFVLVGSAGSDGTCDVSPKGGPPGFVHSTDDNRLLLPDLNGNNLLDSLSNVIETGRAGLLFLVPGRTETLRVNGRAGVTTDDGILDAFEEFRRPKAALEVSVDQVFIHCGKAIKRAELWDAESWGRVEAPSAGEMLVCHTGIDTAPSDLDARLADSYERDLARDLPG